MSSSSGMSSGFDWTLDDVKAYENAIVVHLNKPNRWHLIAECIPNKTPQDVERYYQQLEDDILMIDSGKVPVPQYLNTSSTASPLHALASEDAVTIRRAASPKKGKSTVAEATNNPADRRKGVPWTEEEHKLFLLGLAKFGKGDWRSIARNFVVSRTPTQVASHAQKYFIRLNNNNKKDKRRASIHDITSVSLSEMAQHPSLADKLDKSLSAAASPDGEQLLMDMQS